MITLRNSILLLVFVATAFSFTSKTLQHAHDNESEIVKPVQSAIEGTYTGTLTYLGSGGNIITNTEGTAKISKNGKTYDITFSDKVPPLMGLVFADNDGSYATISSEDSVSGIDIDEGDLTIGVMKEGNSWAFSGEK